MITAGEMLELTNRYKGIMQTSTCTRDKRLATMMTDMEQAYSIPFLNDELYNERYPFVVRMYRTLGESRRFESVAN